MMSPNFMDTNLRDIIGQEELSSDTLYDPQYQTNMYLVESALRETGADKSHAALVRSPYDEAIMRLINSVPVR